MAVVALIEASEVPTELAAKVSETVLSMMVDGASAAAYRAAPCLKDSPTDEQRAEARLIVLSAVERWLRDGSGSVGTTHTAGPFSTTTTPVSPRSSGYRLWPSEVSDLQAVCRGGGLTSVELVSSQGSRRTFADTFDAGPPS